MNELIKELDELNRKLATLRLKKENLEKEIVAQLDHPDEGQRTYEFGGYKLTVKKSMSLSLDRKSYLEVAGDLCDDPVRTSINYSINIPKFRELRDAGHDFEFITEREPLVKLSLEVAS